MLRQQAEAKTQQFKAPAVSLATAQQLDARLRELYEFLSEMVRHFNQATPAFARKLSLIYESELPELSLSEGFVDYRTKKISDKDVLDYITFTYRMSADRQIKVDLVRDEVARMQAELERLGAKHEISLFKDDFGHVRRATFLIPCQFPCNAILRADYQNMRLQVQSRNVGLLGPAKYTIAAADLSDELMDELGKLILGVPGRFDSEFRA